MYAFEDDYSEECEFVVCRDTSTITSASEALLREDPQSYTEERGTMNPVSRSYLRFQSFSKMLFEDKYRVDRYSQVVCSLWYRDENGLHVLRVLYEMLLLDNVG